MQAHVQVYLFHRRGLKLGYSRKNPKRGGGGWGRSGVELRTWNFQGYWKKSLWKFEGSIKKEMQFPGVFKKYSCGISRGLGF